jgi:hypothetical protein
MFGSLVAATPRKFDPAQEEGEEEEGKEEGVIGKKVQKEAKQEVGVEKDKKKVPEEKEKEKQDKALKVMPNSPDVATRSKKRPISEEQKPNKRKRRRITHDRPASSQTKD